MSNIGTSSSGDESSSPIASPQPTGSKSNFSSRSHVIEPQAPSRGRPTTRLATRPPKRPGSISPSPAGTQANSPASEKTKSQTAHSLSQIYHKSLSKAQTRSLTSLDSSFFLSLKNQLPKGIKQRHQAVGKPKPRPGFRRRKARQRFGCSTSVHHGFLFSDTEALNSNRLLATSSRLSPAAQPPTLRARSPGIRLAAMADLLSPSARPFRPRALSPSKCLAAVASQHNPSAHPSQLRVGSPGKRRATRAAKSSSASSCL